MDNPSLQDLTGFAVDLGGTKLAAAAIEKGRVTNVVVRRTAGGSGPNVLVSELAQISKDVGFEFGQPIGVAVAGLLDKKGLWTAVNRSILSDLCELPLAQHLNESFGSGVIALNDTQAAAIGEFQYGAAQGSGSAAYLTVSTGISAGFVLNGKTLHSPNGMLGHVGFMTSLRGGRECGSGRFGTFESIASGRSIETRAKSLGHDVDCESVFERAGAGTKWALDLIDDSSAAIAELCANLSACLGVERVVLGGGVGLAPEYIERVQRHLENEPSLFRPDLVSAGLGKNSALFGALSTAIERRMS